jgi:ribosome maturation factor RimP
VASPQSAIGPRLAALLAPVVESAGLDLEQVEVVPAGRRRVVRVLVERDGGVSLDDIAAASHDISALLDGDPAASAALGGAPYVLEVSSPGVDRPLVEPRHWRRARGRLVKVTVTSREPNALIVGRVVDVDNGGVRLLLEDGEQRSLRFDELGPGRVQVEFNRLASDDSTDVSNVHAEESR